VKIIISERQQKLLTERFSEENLRKFLYSFWNTQKREGETPHLSEDIYDVVGIKKNTNEDLKMIRPIWYEYNGGFNNLYEKLKEEVLGNTFDLVVPELNLETLVKVVDVTKTSRFGYKYDVVDLIIDIDGNGTTSYEFLDPDTEEQSLVRGSLWDALYEAQEAYETGDFFGALNYQCYEFFYKLLEKYGIPIDVEVDLENFD
jgi:hypothetical protein